jgi:dihydrolipoamide dehydrogenase
MAELPPSMVVIGGGVIGVELSCALNALGCHITIVEALSRLAPTLDGEIAAQLAKSLDKQGITLLMNHRVVRVEDGDACARVVVEHDGQETTLEAPRLLCAVGRRPYIDGLGLEAAGIRFEGNRILVDERQETNIPGIYAIGDCVGQVMLAHTASAQGEVAAENAMGHSRTYRPGCVPSGVYAFPEAAGAGLTEEEAQAQHIAYHVGRFPLAANGRALITNGGEGMVKVLVGDELNALLGVHIIGPNAMEMIGEAAAAISLEATVEDLTETIHAHPTVTEAIREAALAAEHRAIHITNKAERR